MHRGTIKKTLSLILIVSVCMSSLSGCNKKETGSKYEEEITIDVFDSLANYQGIQNGWFAKIVKDKFNMRLNIIAPNVSGGGSIMFDTRCAAGNLGDLIICNGDANTLNSLVNSGLIIDMSSYLEGKDIMRFTEAIGSINSSFDNNSIYAIPTEISTASAITPSEIVEPTYGPYIRWDLYKKLGYPKISTLEDLLPILKDMQDLYPQTESGQKVYAFSFFKDWDGNLVNCVKQPCCFYGYDEIGFVLAKADGSDYQNIVDSDSMYVRVLKFFNEANRLGLVDPESITQNIESVSDKTKDGAVLFCPWPWLSQSLYNTNEKMNAGEGFMMAPIDDLLVFSYGCNIYGSKTSVVCVGKNTKYADRIVDFIDWLYSDEGVFCNNSHKSMAAAGPLGLTWEITDEGPKLTEFGLRCFTENEVEMPEEWGGGTWESGVSALNFKPVSNNELSKDGICFSYTSWPSYIENKSTVLEKDWQDKMGSLTTLDYLKDNNKLIVAAGCQFNMPPQANDISTIRNQCREVICNYSWQMIFAETEEDFSALLKEMQDTLDYMDYNRVLEYDMKTAFSQDIARMNAAALATANEHK